jgi:NADH-quinone oxidoreductase subunit H
MKKFSVTRIPVRNRFQPKMNYIMLLIAILKIISIVIPLLVAVAYFTIAKRKIMGSIQRRRGPNVVGFMGLLQPFADGLKLFVKETTIPTTADTGVFLLAPGIEGGTQVSCLLWGIKP